MDFIIFIALIAIAFALFFDFTNGFHDAANLVATVIVSRALLPNRALMLAAVGEFIGAYFLGTAVAETIGKGIVDPTVLRTGVSGVYVIIAALIGAIFWNLLTWYFGMPSSSSHALVGGLIGSFIVGFGIDPIHWQKVLLIVLVMVLSPFVGFFATYLFTSSTYHVSKWLTPRANRTFNRLQIVSMITQALSHGTNDAQKTMGVITFVLLILGLYAPGSVGEIFVPGWVVFVCSLAIAFGTLVGGWRIIKTLGSRLYTVRPIHAFASQAVSSIILYSTALLGYPISTTQVISSSVMGAGAATRPTLVRWQVAREMVSAWLVTIPASAGIAAATLYGIRFIVF